jgi:hypothetical protein
LTEWGKERKLFGWVGVAVPIKVDMPCTLLAGKVPG